MKRTLLLSLLLGFGVLGAVRAQPPAASAPKMVEVETVKDNLWVLRGGGGNTAVFATADGVTVVDAKNPGWGQTILDKIKELTPKPVTRLINTHTHGDHVSGNVEFPASVEVIAQENTKANMEKMPIFKEHNGTGLAKTAFQDKMTLGAGADQIDLYYFGRAHTNGDAWVVFKAHRIVHSGDMFAGKGVPLVDPSNGGSMLHYPDNLMKAYNGIKDVDMIINGHAPTLSTWADLKEFADFNKELVTWIQAELKAGKTPEQAAAEWKLPEKYKGYSSNVSQLFGGLPGRIQSVADEMKN